MDREVPGEGQYDEEYPAEGGYYDEDYYYFEERRKKRRLWLIIAGLIVVFAICACVGCLGAVGIGLVLNVGGESSNPTLSAEETAPPPASGDETPASADTPASEPLRFSGSGKQASPKFMLNSGIAIFRMTHDGSGDFIVSLLDSDGNPVVNSNGVSPIVIEMGAFNGSIAVGIQRKGEYVLDITADGNWTVVVEQ